MHHGGGGEGPCGQMPAGSGSHTGSRPQPQNEPPSEPQQ
jgi:hypothetical protein